VKNEKELLLDSIVQKIKTKNRLPFEEELKAYALEFKEFGLGKNKALDLIASQFGSRSYKAFKKKLPQPVLTSTLNSDEDINFLGSNFHILSTLFTFCTRHDEYVISLDNMQINEYAKAIKLEKQDKDALNELGDYFRTIFMEQQYFFKDYSFFIFSQLSLNPDEVTLRITLNETFIEFILEHEAFNDIYNLIYNKTIEQTSGIRRNNADDMYEMAQYHFKDKHKFENQKNIVEGIAINPELPKEFFSTDNNDRENIELENWWRRAFIRTQEFFNVGYEQYVQNSKTYGDGDIITLEEFNKDLEDRRESWNKHWKTGTRYDIYILDGGARDRPTSKGKVGSLDEAIEIVRQLDL